MSRHFGFLFAILVWTAETVDVRAADPIPIVIDCTIRSETDVFEPQQPIILDVTLLRAPTHDPLSLRAVLTDLSSPEHQIIVEYSTRLTPPDPLSIPFVTPEKEGVYEITLTARQEVQVNRSFPAISRMPTVAGHVGEIRRQFVVVISHVSSRSAGDWTLLDTRSLLTTDTDSPSRRQLFPMPKVADLPKISDLPRPTNLMSHYPFGKRTSPPQTSDSSDPIERTPGKYPWLTEPLRRFPGMGSMFLHESKGHFMEQSEHHPGFSALSPAGVDGCTWYALPIDVEVGNSYLLEIDYPSNIPQTFGIGVADTTLSRVRDGSFDGMMSIAANIHVAEEIVQSTHTEAVATHQLLFWATTKNHELVLVNHQPNREALFRNIRISQVTPSRPEDQRLPKLFEGAAQRKRIAQLTGGTSFQGRAVSGQYTIFNSMMSRQETYERSSRLIDTLCRGGYDGLALTVLSVYSRLYPTDKIADRENIIPQLDCLEMMFRQFDKEELTLIPAIEFSMLLSSPEQLIIQHPEITEEIRMGGVYNLLHPSVQQAMAEIVLDLVARFGQHPSFGGVAVVLSPGTYAQLPFALYPPDDYTFAQFRRETEETLGIPFLDEQYLHQAMATQSMPIQQFLTQKNAGRVQFLQSHPKVWETWIRWRAAKISGFYADLAQQVSAQRPEAPLYLLGGTMFDHPNIQEYCRPTLPRSPVPLPLQAMQLLGFDMPLISKAESLLFLKPVQISETRSFGYEGLNSPEIITHFSKSGIVSGVQFVHGGSLGGDTVSNSYGENFVFTPAHTQSRKRFVQQLAQADVFTFFDGGVSVPFGQESAMFDLLNTYRRLPHVPFQTFQPAEDSPSFQPLTVRYKNLPDEMFVYIVNDAPFAVEADFLFSADSKCTMTELTGQRMVRSLNRSLQGTGSHVWRASLLPYDFLAIRIGDTHAKIESVTVYCPPSLCGTEGAFKHKVDELKRRVNAARSGVRFDGLVNADFESPLDATCGIAGWQCYGKSLTAQQEQISVEQHCVKLMNGSEGAGTFLSHQPLTIPATGRLGVSMNVGVPADFKSFPMSVVLSATHHGKPYWRSVSVEERLTPLLANVEPKNGVRWHRLVVPFDRLPLEALTEVRIGVQYSGSGVVWLDDITLYQVLFSANEMMELQKMLVVADRFCTSGRVSDLTSQLEGYWAQFLFQHVPVAIPQPTVASSKPSVASEVPPSPKPTLYQRAKQWGGW